MDMKTTGKMRKALVTKRRCELEAGTDNLT